MFCKIPSLYCRKKKTLKSKINNLSSAAGTLRPRLLKSPLLQTRLGGEVRIYCCCLLCADILCNPPERLGPILAQTLVVGVGGSGGLAW